MRALQIGLGGMKSGIGGLERYYFSLMHALPEQGTDVRGLVLGDAGTAVGISSFAPEGVSVFERWSALRNALAGAIHESDLLVSHFALNAFGILDRIGKKPFVIHFHGPWALESAAEGAGALSVAAKRVLERLVYNRGARFIVLSQAFSWILQREYHVPESLIRVVPGGVDVRRFSEVGSRQDARAALGWGMDRPTIVTVRRLVRAKGLENLIAALALVKPDIPDVLLVIVGTGPLGDELKARVRDAGLQQNIHFAGYVGEDSLPSVYRAGDLFVVPTITLEGFGLVVIEALACGTPVLVTPVGGLPEVVSALSPSLVLPSVDARDLAAGILDALSGRKPLPTEAECRTYSERFDWPVIAKQVNTVYREVVAG